MVRQHLPQLLARLVKQAVDGCIQRRRAAKETPQPESGAHRPAAPGKERDQQPAAKFAGIQKRRVQRRGDFRLQPRLLVQADFQVGQQQQLGPPPGITLEQSRIVTGKGLAQIALPVGRITRAQRGAKGDDLRCVRRDVIQTGRDKRANIIPISAKTFWFPRATASLARSIAAKGFSTSQTRASTVVPRCGVPTSRTAVATSAAASVDAGASCRSRSSARVRSSRRMVAPACREAQVAKVHQLAVAGAPGHGHGQFVVALRDPQVAQHRVHQCGDALDVGNGWGLGVSRRLAHGLHFTPGAGTATAPTRRKRGLPTDSSIARLLRRTGRVHHR